jgi:hypothetical protein
MTSKVTTETLEAMGYEDLDDLIKEATKLREQKHADAHQKLLTAFNDAPPRVQDTRGVLQHRQS